MAHLWTFLMIYCGIGLVCERMLYGYCIKIYSMLEVMNHEFVLINSMLILSETGHSAREGV